MPEKKTIARARRDKRQGKAATTQAGEFVREEFERVRAGKADVKNDKQAIAIGLSKARRAGVAIPEKGAAKTRSSAKNKTKKTKASGAAKTRASRTPKRATAKRSTARRAPSTSRARRGTGRSPRRTGTTRSARHAA